MNKLKCSCSQKAYFVCEEHEILLCKDHAKNHKCKLNDSSKFKNKIMNQYDENLSYIQNFKKEKTQIFFEIKKINEGVIQDQKERINLIFDLTKNMIELNKLKKTTFFNNYLNYDFEKIEKNFSDLQQKGLIFELKKELEKKEVLKIQNDFQYKANDLKMFLKD